MNNTPELLSPAGDLDKMRFGIAYGADAVYMAGTRFGMRAAATNFDDNALREGIAYAHAHGVKCYITVNIMPSNRDLPALPAYLELLQDVGADALIIADVGVLRMARRYAPRVPVHISTQTSILNHEAANYWADEGAERIVRVSFPLRRSPKSVQKPRRNSRLRPSFMVPCAFRTPAAA